MFLSSGLYLTRGAYNTAAGGPDNGLEALNTTQHFYKSNTDTLAVITAPGYFPNTLGSFSISTQGFISVNDFILIEGSDAFGLFQIQSLNPFTLSSAGSTPDIITATFTTRFLGPPPDITNPVTFNIMKIGKFVTLTTDRTDVPTTGPVAFLFYSNQTPLPAAFIPAPATSPSGWFKITQSSVFSLAEILVAFNQIQIYASPTHAVNFSPSTPTTLGPGYITYVTA